MSLSNKKSLVLNTIFSSISRGSDVLFLLLLILAARYLGNDDFGKFSFALALTGIFAFTTDLGLKTFLVREIARDKNDSLFLFGNALTIKTILSILTIAILVTLALIMPISKESRIIIYLLTLHMIFKSFKLVFRSIIIANERFKLETLTVTIERILLIVFGGLVLILGYGLITFAAVFTVIGMVNLSVTIYVVRSKIIRPKFFRDLTTIKYLLKKSTPFWLTSAAFGLYFRLDSVMLSLMRGDAEVGWYNAAYRIIEGLIAIPMILYHVLFPRLSILHMESKEAVEKLSQRGCKYLIAISLPIAFLGIITAEPLIYLIYGVEYTQAINAWQILLLGISFVFLWNIFIVLLNSINHPKVPFMGIMIGLIGNVALNLFLIPAYGHLGASISTVIAEIVFCSFLLIALSRYGYQFNLIKYSIRPILASVLSIAMIFLIRDMNAILIVLVGSSIYFLILFLSGFFDADEIKLYHELKLSLSKLKVKNIQ